MSSKKIELDRMVDKSLAKLKTVKQRSSPLCPYMTDKDVYQKLDTPATMGRDWVKEEHNSKTKKYIDEDPEVVDQVLKGDKSIEYSLKFKLRDHVQDLFNSLATVDKDHTKVSTMRSSYMFGEKMRQELHTIETGNRKRTNAYSKWAEQRAHAKQLGLSSK